MQLNGGNEERGNLAGQHQVQVFDRGTGRAHEVFPHQVGVQLWFFGTSGFEEGDETNRVEDGHGGQFALALGHGGEAVRKHSAELRLKRSLVGVVCVSSRVAREVTQGIKI